MLRRKHQEGGAAQRVGPGSEDGDTSPEYMGENRHRDIRRLIAKMAFAVERD